MCFRGLRSRFLLLVMLLSAAFGLLACDGVVYLRTCVAEVSESYRDQVTPHLPLYTRTDSGVSYSFGASALAGPGRGITVSTQFSFLVILRNLEWDTLFFQPMSFELSSSSGAVPIDHYWTRDFATGRERILPVDTTISLARGDSLGLHFLTSSGIPTDTWYNVWLLIGPLRTDTGKSIIELDSICLRD